MTTNNKGPLWEAMHLSALWKGRAEEEGRGPWVAVAPGCLDQVKGQAKARPGPSDLGLSGLNNLQADNECH